MRKKGGATIDKQEIKILFLEDNREDAQTEALQIQRNGFIVSWRMASTEKEFKKELTKEKPDIILADYNLPSFNGKSALKLKQKIAPDIPFIMISGKDEENFVIECIKSGATDILQKDRICLLGSVVRRAIHEAKIYQDRIRTERALQESEQQYRLLAETARDLILIIDLEGNIIYANEAGAYYLGYSREMMTGMNISYFLYPDSLALEEKNRKDRMNLQKNGYAFELDLLDSENKAIPYEVNSSPFIKDKKVIGVLYIARDIIKRKKVENKLKNTISQLKQTMNATIMTMAKVVETRDPYTAGHQRNVSRLATSIASEMGLSDKEIEGIKVASFLHDIGKLDIPSDLLSKPRRLNEVEFNLIKSHPQIGYDILKNINFPWPVSQLILQHHERLDGSGYPKGLKGKEIEMGAKIIAVADVVEAMSSHRPYRPALGLERALQEIKDYSGILYDEDVVKTCTCLFKEKEHILHFKVINYL